MKTPARSLIFGEVLFDRFPDGSEVLGGAPFNVAWNLRGLGQDPLLISRVGEDSLGTSILAAMDAFGLDASGIQRDPRRPTGTVEVELVEDEPRFDIVADRAYDFIQFAAAEESAFEGERGPEILYHGSLALRSEESAAAAAGILRRGASIQPPTEVFFDLNLRSPWWRPEQIEDWMRGAHHLKLNEDELASVEPGPKSFEARAEALLSRSGARTIYITRGSQGAFALSSRGDRAESGPSSGVEVVDTVGAGDAFASVLMMGLLRRWPLQRTLDRAQEFAEAVVGLRGATTTDPGFYTRFQTGWSDS